MHGSQCESPLLERRLAYEFNVLLSVTAVYLALLGLGFIFAPQTIGVGAIPADAVPALIAYLRMFGPAFLGIAVLNRLLETISESALWRVILNVESRLMPDPVMLPVTELHRGTISE